MFQVIFDMDGVIFDSENTFLSCWLEAGARHGMEPELVRRTYMQCIGTNSNQTAEIYRKAFLARLGETDMHRMWDDSVALHRARYSGENMPIKPGVREILTFLKAAGVPVGIASSTQKRKVEQRIRTAGLDDYFVGAIGGDAVKISKPNPEIYLLACETFGFAPERTFAIEDSFNGIRAAGAAGMRPIMVPDIVPPDAEMRALAETICADLFEAMEYLKEQTRNNSLEKSSKS